MSTTKPKILFLDIETQPDLVWTWGVYESNALEVKEHWQMLSFSAEWMDGAIITKGLCDYSGYKPGGSDKRLSKDIWDLLDEADIVVAHHGKQFDIKKINARFIAHCMTPPSPYQVVDTLTELRRLAAFSSNKLDWICKQLDIGGKIVHQGWALWRGCMNGDEKCWKKMKKYNRHDIVLLKELYYALQPWLRQPSAGLWDPNAVCPNPACGSMDVTRQGLKRTRTRVYQQFKCKQCGSWGRTVKSEADKASTVGV